MWMNFKYLPTNLFSLRRSDATLPAAKSLLIPSPYAVKMALLDVIITFDSLKKVIDKFDLIHKMNIKIKLPEYVCSNNCFVKIWKYDLSHPEPDGNCWKSTVAFREYIYFSDEINIAVDYQNEEDRIFLLTNFSRINYFGKRGGFFQFTGYEDNVQELDDNYSNDIDIKNNQLDLSKIKTGIIQPVDDFGDVDFDSVSNYSDKKTDRRKRLFNLPFRVIKSNKNFTLYKRIT